MGRFDQDTRPEAREANSFPELVLNSVRDWREQRSDLPAFSAAVEIPGISRYGMDLVRRNFPDYISEDIQVEILRTHPEPITTAAVFMDKRSLLGQGGRLESKQSYPPDISKNEETSWKNGISILDEIAAETLAQDILNKAAGKEAKIPSSLSPFGSGYEKGYYELAQLFVNRTGSLNLFDSFTCELVLVGLTNDRGRVNEISNLLGFSSIDKLAARIGRNNRYENTLSSKGRLLHSYNVSGTYGVYPGIIGLIFAREALTALTLGGTAFWATTLDTFSLPVLGAVTASTVIQSRKIISEIKRVWLHELAHYFLSGLDHTGLRPVAWKLY